MPCPERAHNHKWPALPLKADLSIQKCERSCGWCVQTCQTAAVLCRHARTHLPKDSVFGVAASETAGKFTIVERAQLLFPPSQERDCSGDTEMSIPSTGSPTEPPTESPVVAGVSRPLSNSGFNLAPAIFVPFLSVDIDKAKPQDRDEKIKRILEDLDKQQDAVRRNMMFLVDVQKGKLLSDAREALKSEERKHSVELSKSDELSGSANGQDIKDLLVSLKVPAGRGTNGKEFEYRDGDFTRRKVVDADGDATMSGTDNSEPPTTTVQHELSVALQELVVRSASDMEAYDRHAESTKDYYRRALERSAARRGSLDTANTTGGAATAMNVDSGKLRGILGNRNDEIRVDRDAWARMIIEEQSHTPNLPIGSVDVSKNPARISVDVPWGPRLSSADLAGDQRRGASGDIWRR